MTDQEEEDPRLLFHAKHARDAGYGDVIIHTPDTDVFILMLSFSNQINNLFVFLFFLYQVKRDTKPQKIGRVINTDPSMAVTAFLSPS